MMDEFKILNEVVPILSLVTELCNPKILKENSFLYFCASYIVNFFLRELYGVAGIITLKNLYNF